MLNLLVIKHRHPTPKCSLFKRKATCNCMARWKINMEKGKRRRFSHFSHTCHHTHLDDSKEQLPDSSYHFAWHHRSADCMTIHCNWPTGWKTSKGWLTAYSNWWRVHSSLLTTHRCWLTAHTVTTTWLTAYGCWETAQSRWLIYISNWLKAITCSSNWLTAPTATDCYHNS